MADHIHLDVADHIATITIDRPEKRNAMTYAVLGDFIEAVHAAGADQAVRVVVVTGVPGAFCAGTDLSDLSSVPGEQRGLRGRAEERGPVAYVGRRLRAGDERGAELGGRRPEGEDRGDPGPVHDPSGRDHRNVEGPHQ